MQTSTFSQQKPRLGMWTLRILGILAFAAILSIVFVVTQPARAGVSDSSVSSFGAKGDGVTDDGAAFRAALSAAPAGSTVLVPPATYRIGSTVKLKSGVTLSGPGATIYMPSSSSTSILFDVDGTAGAGIVGLRLRSDAVTTNGRNGSYVIGIGGVSKGASDLTVRDLVTENLKYGMKLGSSGTSYRLMVQNWVGRGDTQSLYLGSVKGGTLTNLDFDCRNSSDLDHNIYLELGNADLVFDTVRLAGGTGYSLHLYMDSTASADRGQRITFRHVRLDSPNQGVVVERYDGVTFEDLTGSTVASDAFFVIYTMTNLSVDGFDVAGTPYAFLADNDNGPISGVTLRNGVFRQPKLLGNGSAVSGLVVENTSSSTSPQTTTTVRPTTTTSSTTTTTSATTNTTRASATTTTTRASATTTTTTEPPTTTRTTAPRETTTTTVPRSSQELLINPGFEIDANSDGRPDNWLSSQRFTRSTGLTHGGPYSAKFYATNNTSVSGGQTVPVTAGRSYTFSGWVNIPPSKDTFSFELQLKFRNAARTVIKVRAIRTYTAATNGWDNPTLTVVAPAGATAAYLQIDANSLGLPIYVDDFSLGSGAQPSPTTPRSRGTRLEATATTATNAVEAAAPVFTDVPGSHEYATEISALATRGIVTGMVDGSFKPDDPVTRQQFAKMIDLTLGLPVTEADVSPFIDIDTPPDDLYPDNYIAVAARSGLTAGTTNERFSPEASITRAQVVSMAVRAAKAIHGELLATPPAGYSPAWVDFGTDHEQNARIAQYNGLLTGLNVGDLDPWGNMTRGEAAQVLCNLSYLLGTER